MALDTSKAKDSLFGNIKKAKEPQSIETEIKSETLSHHVDLAPSIAEVNKQETEENRVEELAKWRQFDKITALLTSEQKEGLDRVAKKLMKHRSKELKGNENTNHGGTESTDIHGKICVNLCPLCLCGKY